MQFRSRKRIVFSSIIGLLFSGCISSGGEYKNHTVRTPPKHVYRNMTRINQYKDKYQIILGNFGASLSDYARLKYSTYRDINIEVNEIENKTSDGKIPISSQGMLINSVGMLTATSKNFFIPRKIMIDKGTFIAEDDMNSYLNGVARVLQLEGSIDRSDVIYSKSNALSGDATMTYRGHRADLGFEREDKDNIREISLSLRFIDKRKGKGFNTYARYGHAENSIRVAKKTDGSGFGVFLLGSGVTNSSFKTYTPGVHQAIKILIQHTLIQAFGRYFEVPYWHCSDMYTVDEVQKNNMRLDWNSKSHDKKIRDIQLVLNMYGFSIPMDAKDEKEKKLALKKTDLALNAIKNCLGISGNIENFNYYFNLYNNMPFAGFFPNNYNNLRAEIINLNSGNLPNYVDNNPRPLPAKPNKRNQNSTVIIHSGRDIDIISDRSSRTDRVEKYQETRRYTPTRRPSFYDKNKQSIDDAEANLFK